MRALIAGRGEVGQSLFKVLLFAYGFKDLHTIDKNTDAKQTEYDILHICFPYSDTFILDVQTYQINYKPKYTVIHSTVPVGTSRKCNAIHSPIVGMHPDLMPSLLTFTKFLSGQDASQVADYFRKAGIKVFLFDNQETTELLKLLDTEYYRININYTKYIKEMCDKYKVPFEAWTLYNSSYNRGYKLLGHDDVVRPNLVPIMTEIGGHCLVPNSKLIEETFEQYESRKSKTTPEGTN